MAVYRVVVAAGFLLTVAPLGCDEPAKSPRVPPPTSLDDCETRYGNLHDRWGNSIGGDKFNACVAEVQDRQERHAAQEARATVRRTHPAVPSASALPDVGDAGGGDPGQDDDAKGVQACVDSFHATDQDTLTKLGAACERALVLRPDAGSATEAMESVKQEIQQRQAAQARERAAQQDAAQNAAEPGRQAFAAGDFKASCDQHYSRGCVVLGFKNGCASGDGEACRKIGDVFLNGWDVLPADKQKAVPFFERACGLLPTTCAELAVVVMAGLPPQATLEPKIRSFVDRACTVSGDMCAQSCAQFESITMDQRSPPDIFKQRKVFALACYKKACSLGSGSACALATSGGTTGTLR